MMSAPTQLAHKPASHGATRSPEPQVMTAEPARHAGHALPSLAPEGGPVIQRAIAAPDADRVPLALRAQIAEQLAAHNDHEHRDSNEEGHLHAQFTRVDRLQRTVQAHLRDHSADVNDDQRRELFGLLGRAQEEHVALTGRLLDNDRQAWVRPGQEDHAHEIRGTWNALRANTGGLRFRDGTSDAYKRRTMSGYAQLLQGTHGRQLLADLNAPADEGHTVIVHEPGPMQDSSATPLRGDLAHNSVVGTGSNVTVTPPDVQAPIDLDNSGMDTGGRPIFAPAFMNLGHELGHARAFKFGRGAGGSTIAGEPSWSNHEERRNITQDENTLRGEHDMPQREFHATRRAHRANVARAGLEAHIDQVDQHYDALDFPDGSGASLANTRRRVELVDASNAEEVAAIHAHLNRLIGPDAQGAFAADALDRRLRDERQAREHDEAQAQVAARQQPPQPVHNTPVINQAQPGLLRRAYNYVRANPVRAGIGGAVAAGGLALLHQFIRSRMGS